MVCYLHKEMNEQKIHAYVSKDSTFVYCTYLRIREVDMYVDTYVLASFTSAYSMYNYVHLYLLYTYVWHDGSKA